MEKTINSVVLRTFGGDICDRKVDALVNAANNELWMGGGVAGAIKRVGGKEIEQEAMRQGPIPVGAAVVTGGGSLRARHVIHAAVMGNNLKTGADEIRRATLSALNRAKELGLRSIAFPALGTGVGGFPIEECARIMYQAMVGHVVGGTSLQMIEIVLFGREAYDAFDHALAGG